MQLERRTYSSQHYRGEELPLDLPEKPKSESYGELTKVEFEFFTAHFQDADHRKHFEKLIAKRAARRAEQQGEQSCLAQ